MRNWKDGRRPGDLALVHTLVIRSDRNTNWQIDLGSVWCSAWYGRKGGERVLTLTIPPGELALLGDLMPPLGRSRWGCSLVPGVGDARMALPALGHAPPPAAEIREGKREREGDGEMNLGGEQVTG